MDFCLTIYLQKEQHHRFKIWFICVTTNDEQLLPFTIPRFSLISHGSLGVVGTLVSTTDLAIRVFFLLSLLVWSISTGTAEIYTISVNVSPTVSLRINILLEVVAHL